MIVHGLFGHGHVSIHVLKILLVGRGAPRSTAVAMHREIECVAPDFPGSVV